MIDFEERLNELERDISAIKEKVSFFSVIYEKFDRTLDKLDERQTTDRKEIYERIDTLQETLVQEIKHLRDDMAKQHVIENKKIDDLNRWRWLVMGGAAVLGWLFSKIINLK
jgi:regulator of replication initiation timing